MSGIPDFSWVPAGVRMSGSGLRLCWRRLGSVRFTHSFYRETLQCAPPEPVLETAWELLKFSPAEILPPAGFIFHLSRCGSTLLTQMLATAPENVVLSEPGPVNDLLWPATPLHPPEGKADSGAWLKTLIAALGRRRFPGEERLIVKFDSWHTLDLPLLRRVFPEVPWLFVYRAPGDILASHERSRGSQMIPGFLDSEKLAVPAPPWTSDGLRSFAAGVLARIAAAALENHDPLCRLVHYRELPAVFPAVLRHFRIPVTPPQLAAMTLAAGRDSKRPDRLFDARRRAPETASAQPSRAAGEQAWILYQQLEALRLAQPAD